MGVAKDNSAGRTEGEQYNFLVLPLLLFYKDKRRR